MKTKIIRNLAVWILIGVLALSGCGAPPEAENIPEESAGWDIVTYAPKEMESRQYHWVILQNGRNVIDQTGTDRINERLKELKVDAALCFHVVTMQEYVPPQILDAVYQQLDGQMDFVSIGPALCGFSMDEWSQCFLELTDELQNGEMRQFYETVPPVVWEANQIADGLYSFSDSSTVVVWGCIFDEEAQEKWGRENLLKLQQTKGVEKEEIWQELYEL